MRLRKYFKTVLSAMLAAAMVVTSVPANTAYAATIQTTEETAVVEEETTQQPVTETTVETQEIQVDATEETNYAGPTIGTDGSVTFYYTDTESAETVSVKGSWNWDAAIAMSKENENENLWTVTVPIETIGWNNVSYGFSLTGGDVATINNGWRNDSTNPTGDGSTNSAIMRNPSIDGTGKVTLYYYPEHGTYPTSVEVAYRVKGSEAEYTKVDMATDATYSKIYSVSIEGLTDGTYEYKFIVDGSKEITDTNNATAGEFTKETVQYPEKKDDVKSPVVEGRNVTFNYYAHEGNMPKADSVKVAGTMTNPTWNDDAAYNMSYSEDGYWSYTATLAPGKYEYKFIVAGAGDWQQDPLNAETSII